MKHVRDFHSQSWSNPFFARQAGLSRLKKVLIALGCILVLAGLAYALVYSPLLRSSRVEVSGNETVSADDVKNAVYEELKGFDFFVLPKDHLWIINAAAIEHDLLAKYSNFRNIAVQNKFDKIVVAIEERKPTFRLMSGDRSYLLDQQGIGMREEVAGEGDKLIAVSQDGLTFSAGITMLPGGWAPALLDIHKYFATLTGVHDKIIWLGPIDGQVQVVTNEGWYATIDPMADIKTQLSSLSSALLGKFNFDERTKLKYIDVRFGDRIFYKWK